MHYMLISRMHANLTATELQRLGELAQAFYDNIPPGVTLHGDWGATDRSRTFALLETDDPDLLKRIQAPFRAYVDMELIPVTPLSGWSMGADSRTNLQ